MIDSASLSAERAKQRYFEMRRQSKWTVRGPSRVRLDNLINANGFYGLVCRAHDGVRIKRWLFTLCLAPDSVCLAPLSRQGVNHTITKVEMRTGHIDSQYLATFYPGQS